MSDNVQSENVQIHLERYQQSKHLNFKHKLINWVLELRIVRGHSVGEEAQYKQRISTTNRVILNSVSLRSKKKSQCQIIVVTRPM